MANSSNYLLSWCPLYALGQAMSLLLHNRINWSLEESGGREAWIFLTLFMRSHKPVWIIQGSFCVCTQPMVDTITLWCCLWLAGRIHKMIPDRQKNIQIIDIHNRTLEKIMSPLYPDVCLLMVLYRQVLGPIQAQSWPSSGCPFVPHQHLNV